MRKLAVAAFFQVLLCLVAQADVRVEVSFDRAVHVGPLTGRVIMVIARAERPEPRLQIAPNTTPLFGADAE